MKSHHIQILPSLAVLCVHFLLHLLSHYLLQHLWVKLPHLTPLHLNALLFLLPLELPSLLDIVFLYWKGPSIIIRYFCRITICRWYIWIINRVYLWSLNVNAMSQRSRLLLNHRMDWRILSWYYSNCSMLTAYFFYTRILDKLVTRFRRWKPIALFIEDMVFPGTT